MNKKRVSDWYSPRIIFRNWQYIMKTLDNIFHDCLVFCSKKNSSNYIDYDVTQHRILIKKGGSYNRVRLVVAIIEMIIFNLAPGTRRVKYNNENCLLVSRLNIFKMAGIIAHKLYPGMSDKWLDWVKNQEVEQKKFIRPSIISKQDLSHMYYDKGLSRQQIADVLGKSLSTINNWMNQYDLPRRNRGSRIYISPQKLDDLYYNQDFTIEEIAKILDVDYKIVWRRMDEYNMPRRDKAYTVPFRNNRARGFRSALRKKFRMNSHYIKIAHELIKEVEGEFKTIDK